VEKYKQWNGFIRKPHLKDTPDILDTIVQELNNFLDHWWLSWLSTECHLVNGQPKAGGKVIKLLNGDKACCSLLDS
jgi:hypothetical protein